MWRMVCCAFKGKNKETKDKETWLTTARDTALVFSQGYLYHMTLERHHMTSKGGENFTRHNEKKTHKLKPISFGMCSDVPCQALLGIQPETSWGESGVAPRNGMMFG